MTATTEAGLPPANQQGLDIRSTPREEMRLYPLDTFAYDYAGREISIRFELPEFTCVCPFSDFPDFATFRIEYTPNERCVELKSLKLYVNSFRDVKVRSEEHTSELQSQSNLVCRLLLEKKKNQLITCFNVNHSFY